MKCWKCGAELPEGQRFCGGCGAEQRTGQETPPPAGEENPGSMGQAGANREIVLKVFAAVCVMVYGGKALRYVFSVLENLVWMLDDYFYFSYLIVFRWILLSAVLALAGVWMCAVLLLTAFKRTEKNAEVIRQVFAESFAVLRSGSGTSARTDRNVREAQAAYEGGAVRMKTDRSLVAYILLSIITCGIYSYYFLYAMARDANVICSADGKKTGGLLAFILLSIVTCGIYGLWVEKRLLQWKARNTSYEGCPVGTEEDGDYDGSVLGLFLVRLVSGLLTLITCGIYSPWAYARITRYQMEHTKYAGMRVAFEGSGGDYFLTWLKSILLSLITCGLYAIIKCPILCWIAENTYFESPE